MGGGIFEVLPSDSRTSLGREEKSSGKEQIDTQSRTPHVSIDSADDFIDGMTNMPFSSASQPRPDDDVVRT